MTGWARRHRLIAGLLVVVVAAAVTSAVTLAMTTHPSNDVVLTSKGGGPAPAVRLPNLRTGATDFDLAAYRGRPVVLNFFASWCVPCREELPALQAVSREVGPTVAFLGIDHEDARSDALATARAAGVAYPLGFDPDGRVAGAFGLFGMPTTVFISPAGTIVERHTGAFTEATLRATVRGLFHV